MLIYTSTKSKKRPNLRPKSERLEYEAWCKKHNISDTGSRKKPVRQVALPGVVTGPSIRTTEKIASLGSFVSGPVNCNNTKKTYTGDKLIGIAAMHKSNLVPVFTDESAVDISHMRR